MNGKFKNNYKYFVSFTQKSFNKLKNHIIKMELQIENRGENSLSKRCRRNNERKFISLKNKKLKSWVTRVN